MKHSPKPSDQPVSAPAYPSDARRGALFATMAFMIWGTIPLYFKSVQSVAPTEVLAHRVLWSMVFVGLLLVVWRRRTAIGSVLRDPRLMGWLTLSALLVSGNWLIFIWAVANDRVLESSLGYYINPLLNVVLGVLILREQLRPLQWFAVMLAAVGVGNLVLEFGRVPWVALGLALSFGLYGLIRKRVAVNAMSGLFVETLLLTPLAIGYLIVLGGRGGAVFGSGSTAMNLLLAAAGVFTATPLILFTAAARRLKLSTLGQLQYTVPTSHLLLAVFVFGETFTRSHAVTFAFIWVALGLYISDTYREDRSRAG